MAIPHGTPGRVSSIDEHHNNSRHATITVTHGKKKRDKTSGDLHSYDQPTSRIIVPKAHAKNYQLGQKVTAGLSAAGGDTDAAADAQGGNDQDEDDIRAASPAKGKGGKGAKTKAGKSAKPSRISQAMMGKSGM
jgi:hypothetical protein